jgi:hypothetical protein
MTVEITLFLRGMRHDLGAKYYIYIYTILYGIIHKKTASLQDLGFPHWFCWGFMSYGMWHYVTLLVFHPHSKGCSASISNDQALQVISLDPLTTKDKGTMFLQNIRKKWSSSTVSHSRSCESSTGHILYNHPLINSMNESDTSLVWYKVINLYSHTQLSVY